jgi:hypothetical protein
VSLFFSKSQIKGTRNKKKILSERVSTRVFFRDGDDDIGRRRGGRDYFQVLYVPDGENDASFAADEPAVWAERDVAQSEPDIGDTGGDLLLFFFFLNEREFEEVGAFARVGDWTGARADAKEGAVEEKLGGRCAPSRRSVVCSFREDGEIERDAEGDAGEADGSERAEVYDGAGDGELTSVA